MSVFIRDPDLFSSIRPHSRRPSTLQYGGVLDLREEATGTRISHTWNPLDRVQDIMHDIQLITSPYDGFGKSTWTTTYASDLHDSYLNVGSASLFMCTAGLLIYH